MTNERGNKSQTVLELIEGKKLSSRQKKEIKDFIDGVKQHVDDGIFDKPKRRQDVGDLVWNIIMNVGGVEAQVQDWFEFDDLFRNTLEDDLAKVYGIK